MISTETGLRALMRTAPLAGVATAALAALGWAFLVSGAGMGMDVLAMSSLGFPRMMSGMSMEVTTPGFFELLAMWWIMMMAMMIPGTLRHVPVPTSAAQKANIAVMGFWVGYGGVWLVFSAFAAMLQMMLTANGLMNAMTMHSNFWPITAMLLALTGVYQLSRLKERNLAACGDFAPSGTPQVDGMRYGLRCLSASAPLMLMMFVFGAMNIYWTIILAVIVAVEKSLNAPRRVSQGIGVISLGIATFVVLSQTMMRLV